MTKRWFSLLMVLTLLATMFTGAVAAPVVKATAPVIKFELAKTSQELLKDESYSDFVLGAFTVDDKTPTSSDISKIRSFTTVKFNGKTAVSYFSIDSNGTLKVDFNAAGAISEASKLTVAVNPTAPYNTVKVIKDIAVTFTVPVAKIVTNVGTDTKQELTVGNHFDFIAVAAASGDKPTASEWVSSAKNKKVIFTSSAEDVVALGTVSDVGGGKQITLTAKKAGTSVITAKTVDGGYSKSFTMTVKNVLPTTVEITKTSGIVAATKVTLGLKWATAPTDVSGVWSVSNEKTAMGNPATTGSIATIDAATGVLSAKDVGTATVKFVANAKTTGGLAVQGTADIKIALPSPAPKKVANASIVVTEGSTVVTPSDNTYSAKGPVTVALDCATLGAQIYYTTDGSAPTESSTAYTRPFTIQKSGLTVIKAITKKANMTNGVLYSEAEGCRVTITPAITGLSLDPASSNIQGSTPLYVSAVVTGAENVSIENKAITWTVNGSSTTAQSDGRLKLDPFGDDADTKDGTEFVVVASNAHSGKTAKGTYIFKKVAPTGIKLDQTSASIAADQQVQLTATVQPENHTDTANVTWVSGNANVAMVTAGLVKGVAAGNTTIQARYTDASGKLYTANCSLTVTAATGIVAAPTISYDKETGKVTMSTTTKGAAIRYETATAPKTVNDPTASSALYSAPIGSFEVNKTYGFKAIAVKGDAPSQVISSITSYSFNTNVAVEKVGLTGWTDGKTTFAGTGTVTPNLTAVVSPADPNGAFDKSVTWSISPATVATLKDNGDSTATITAVAPGTATITVTTKDGGKTATATLTVTEKKPESIEIAGTFNVLAGNTTQLTATVKPGATNNKNVTWKSSNEAVATVDANGLVTAKAFDAEKAANNKVTITATAVATNAAGNPVFMPQEITVTGVVTKVATPSIAVVPLGNAALDNAAGYPVEHEIKITSATAGATIYYTTDNSEPTTASAKYTGPFKLAATTTVKAKAFKDSLITSDVATASIIFSLKVNSITLSKTEASIEMGDTLAINATLAPATATNINETLLVESSDATVAKAEYDNVKKNYKVTPLKAGKTTLTFYTQGTDALSKELVFASCKISVTNVAVQGIDIVNGKAMDLIIGDNKTLVANVLPGKVDQTVTWKLSNTDLATGVVALSGNVVSALKAGTATLIATAKADPAVTAQCVVTVKADPAEIPAEPQKIPVFTSIPATKVYTAIEGSKLTTVVGKLAAGEGETYNQIAYYYNVAVTGIADSTSISGVTYTIGSDGTVTINIPNVGEPMTTGDKTFAFKWTLIAKANRSAVKFDKESRTITGNKLVVTSKDEKAVSDAKDLITKLVVSLSADATTVEKAKEELLKLLNETIKGTSIVLKAADISVTDYVAPTATADGTFKYTVNLKSGDATGSATGTGTVKHEKLPVSIAVNVGAFKGQKNKANMNISNTPASVTFTLKNVPANTEVTWSSSMPKVIKIDPKTGVATLGKTKAQIGKVVTITAKYGKETVTGRYILRNAPTELKLQYKNGSKWVTFDETNALTLKPGASRQFRILGQKQLLPKQAAWLRYEPKSSDDTIAKVGAAKKKIVAGKTDGTEAIITFTTFDGVVVKGKVLVSTTKGLDTELDEVIVDVSDDEVTEVEWVDEAPEVELVEVVDAE